MTTTSKTSSKNRSTKKPDNSTERLRKTAKPEKLTLRSYQVGFGDCYLLTFHYPSSERHVLIDFGSTGQPDGAPDDLMMLVANDIARRSSNKLHIVVATHRHKDHISGFATTKDGDGPGDIIRKCQPDIVIQPWTEDPNARTDATHATITSSGKSFAFTETLHHMQMVSASALAETQTHLRFGLDSGVADQLSFLGEDNLTNRPAVENLKKMGEEGRALYVNCDPENPLDLDDMLPGVTVRVLGPPTLQQSKAIGKQRSSDAAEFWQLQAHSGEPMLGISKPLFPEVASRSAAQLTPPHTRWFIRQVNNIRGAQLLGLVRILDSVMNNTSVILLFEAGNKKLLFPGDAQIENWSYALDQKEVQEMLKDVDVYKVGHHGSRNANPKSLWKLFTKRNSNPKSKRLRSFVSTMAGKHGDPKKHTEVPRQSLIRALKKETELFSTQNLESDAISEAFTIDLKS
jgi:hypothetical protein